MTNTLSHSIAASAFLCLIVLLLISRQRGPVGISLLVACGFSVLWAALAAVSSTGIPLSGITETARVLAWATFLHTLIHTKPKSASTVSSLPEKWQVFRIQWLSECRFSAVLFAALLTTIQITLTVILLTSYTLHSSINFLLPAIWLSSVIIGLAYLESLYRGTAVERRQALRPLCLGLAGMFLLDFFVFTDALLFRRINTELWQARGFFYAFLVPIIAISVARHPDWAVRIHISRQAVTSSITVFGAGSYLLATAVAASFIRLSGTQWANVAQISFVLISLAFLVMLLLSRRLRVLLRVNVSKHFFNFKYDYRKEWLSFTQVLSTGIDDAPAAIVNALTRIMHSDSGALWAKTNDDDWELLAVSGQKNDAQDHFNDWDSLASFMRDTGWIIQLDEYKSRREKYKGLALPAALTNSSTAWLIVPLPDQNDVIGFVIIDRSTIIQTITWEDRDLLKTAGQQAAGLLIQRRSHEALMQARQFEAFSKLSAYVIHDLKNILGQQSLIVSNAEKHKHKPAFVDDVIATVDNSVNRMQSLLEKLREQQEDAVHNTVNLAEIIIDASQLRPHARPEPTVVQGPKDIYLKVDRDKLVRVLGHLIQNAQDATSDNGDIRLSWKQEHDSLVRISISDNGIGMTEEFIKKSLFKPFMSSKGLTGMGIGVYESREYIRKLGGKIAVSSSPGKGSEFTIMLPIIY